MQKERIIIFFITGLGFFFALGALEYYDGMGPLSLESSENRLNTTSTWLVLKDRSGNLFRKSETMKASKSYLDYLMKGTNEYRIDSDKLDNMTRSYFEPSLGLRVEPVKLKDALFYGVVDAHQKMDPKVWGEDPWTYVEVSDKELENLLLPEEWDSAMRNKDGIGKCPASKSFCCFSVTSRGGNPDVYYEKLDTTSRKLGLFSYYKPAKRDQPQHFMDVMNMFLHYMDTKPKSDRLPHIIFWGDSVMEQIYHAFLCGIGRALGASIRKFDSVHLQYQDRFRMPAGGWNENPMLYKRSFIQLNTTSSKLGVQEFQFSFMKHHRLFRDTTLQPEEEQTRHYQTLAIACGLPVNVSISGKHQIVTGNRTIDVLVINHGVHYWHSPEYIMHMRPFIRILTACQKAGLKVIYRDSAAQQFTHDFGGEYAHAISKERDNLDPYLTDEQKKLTCSRVIFNDPALANWRYQVFARLAAEQNVSFNVIPIESDVVCNNLVLEDPATQHQQIQYVPLYATTAPLHYSHFGADCTHYPYSIWSYVSFADGLYKALLQSTLPFGECRKIPRKSAYYFGKEGLMRGERENHNRTFWPEFAKGHPINGNLGSIRASEIPIAPLLTDDRTWSPSVM